MKPWEVIKHLESDNSRLFKESVIREQMLAENDEFFLGLRYCLDSLITFGVKQIPTYTNKIPGVDILSGVGGLDWDFFEECIKNLLQRKVTGYNALTLIQDLMWMSSEDQWNYWHRRILIKDLRCGVSEKTINKVAIELNKPQYSVPVFSCQLAKDQADHQSKMTGTKIVDTKMDGSRVLSVLYTDGRVEQFSRNGKSLENFTIIIEQLKKLTPFIREDLVLDGEVMSSSFQDLMKQLYRKDNVQTDDAVLYLFDWIPLKDFQKGKCKIKQWARIVELQGLLDRVHEEHIPNVRKISARCIDLDSDYGKNELKEINRLAIENGYEGIMIKEKNAPYECKRSTNWLKMKPFITVDLEVIALEEGTGKYEGMLGALICSGVDQDKKITVSVGSGLTDQQRKEFWTDKENIRGRIVEIKADAITHSLDWDNDDYSLRFPVFMGFRNDKE